MIINPAILQPYIDKKLVSVQHHPSEDLHIYNYTQTCQFSGAWDEVTKMCRGLILDGSGKVIARPFDKFFNRGEQGEPHTGVFTAHDKMDGSLGILYPHSGGTKLSIAIRGSFTSDQAIEGTKILQRYIDDRGIKEMFLRETTSKTFMFEIIYPENRIVVDYGKRRDIVLLAVREIETGKINPARYLGFDYPVIINEPDKPRDNTEGVVLYYTDGFMEKVKYEEYVRLHRLVTGVTARRIWDLLKHNQKIDELVERVPEEFAAWVVKTKLDLETEYKKWIDVSTKVYRSALKEATRKEQAEVIKEFNCRGIVFAMLDGKPYDQIIWKMLKPKAERPFREDL